jgi:hypothetical protein
MKEIFRDKAYLLYLRDEPCLFTGVRGSDNESVVACHLGTAGKGIKSPDDEVLPLADHIHKRMHQHGEVSTIRELVPNDVLLKMARAYARELYAEWDHSIRLHDRWRRL